MEESIENVVRRMLEHWRNRRGFTVIGELKGMLSNRYQAVRALAVANMLGWKMTPDEHDQFQIELDQLKRSILADEIALAKEPG